MPDQLSPDAPTLETRLRELAQVSCGHPAWCDMPDDHRAVLTEAADRIGSLQQQIAEKDELLQRKDTQVDWWMRAKGDVSDENQWLRQRLGYTDHMLNDGNELKARAEHSAATVRTLRDALEKFGQHENNCGVMQCSGCDGKNSYGPLLHRDSDHPMFHEPQPKPCDCGFEAALLVSVPPAPAADTETPK